MEPPSYDEACLHPPPALGGVSMGVTPPPTYHPVTLSSPATPPPTYGEAVTMPTDPYPVLAPPMMPVTTPPQRGPNIVHQSTHISESDNRTAGQTVVEVPSQTIHSLALGEHPTVTQCPYCHHNITTQVQHIPGRAAWCTCFIFCLLGFVCGCCLIPFCSEGMQDVHHSCPQCHKHLSTHIR